ncbi:fluoride efflux transporter CrcB [Paenibacillus sp. N3/727]|uniref:fluoride efflux transporter CrcB n=1 Tax=Paenibacillus sp. N3/727 TaxID=2925845 RepID=UPI001F538C57|nr:fluoride efflux transporter CrcB [Paenibacillus sp. N3/727]UNK19891.1 fluoride efflux transporter CrcB [Paenibacillus sp. N3/727]
MILWIGLGGIAGAVSRYCVGVWLGKKAQGTFPWATLLVNLVGSIILGFLAGYADHLSEAVYRMLGTGFCGAFTTFSTFGYEAVTLAGNKQYIQAFLYVLISVMLGLAGAWTGLYIAA